MKKTLVALSILMGLALNVQTTFASCPVYSKHKMKNIQNNKQMIKRHRHTHGRSHVKNSCTTGSACPITKYSTKPWAHPLNVQNQAGVACPYHNSNSIPNCNNSCN